MSDTEKLVVSEPTEQDFQNAKDFIRSLDTAESWGVSTTRLAQLFHTVSRSGGKTADEWRGLNNEAIAAVNRQATMLVKKDQELESWKQHAERATKDAQYWQQQAELAKAELAFVEQELRMRLWLGHGHKGVYGDDGEMQCGECIRYGEVDYKRAPIRTLIEQVQHIRIERFTSGAASSPPEQGKKREEGK